MDTKYRAFVKDCLDLNAVPKAFLIIMSGDVAGDVLTRATSSFTCFEEVPENVHEGDVLVLYAPSGRSIYTGVISAINQKDIDCDQIQALFDYNWFYRLFAKDKLEQEIAEIYTDFKAGVIGDIVGSVPEANEENWLKNKLYLSWDTSVNKYRQYKITREVEREEQENGTYVENVIYQKTQLGVIDASEENWQEFDFTVDGFKTQEDKLFLKKYGAFTITYEGQQSVHLPTPETVDEMRNMEQFMYDVFKDYDVVTQIDIPYGSGCKINFKTADFTGMRIAKNSADIISISPTTEVEDTNKLVVFSADGGYRGTYYATDNGIIENSDSSERLPVINTVYVTSNDSIEDIKANNLKEKLYNHEIVFEMSLQSNLIDFFEWNFGTPLEIIYKGKIYKSIYTGYKYSFSDGAHPTTVEVTCGIVRTRLTDKFNMLNIESSSLLSDRISK